MPQLVHYATATPGPPVLPPPPPALESVFVGLILRSMPTCWLTLYWKLTRMTFSTRKKQYFV
ncbi:hypothetical protein E2C01_016993 [Portunus trituberculatus]|uniref:Uncharacterized protein n=1 Tax=Portunus trituberculatus TaxID=210409 RepID=A0A5B7DSL9_PORTR|nr:hypothetical protein [Portunus trituberculatus]